MRKTLASLALAPLFALTACGDDGGGGTVDASVDAPGGNAGFPTPTAITHANMRTGGQWMDLGPADWSCLDTPSTDQPGVAIALSGTVEDFQSGDPVGNATVTAFPGIMVTGNSGMATSSNVAATRGQYSMNLTALPSGETRFGFKIEATGYLKTYLLNQYLDPAQATQTRNISGISESTANALPAFIGVTRDTADGVLAGAFRDCAGHEVSNAVATVSSVSGQPMHLPGADTYYFSAASQSLPVRHTQSPTMNKDGLFVVLALPPQTAPAFVQIWGFTTQAELDSGTLKLLSELPSPIEANAVITGSFEPKRSN